MTIRFVLQFSALWPKISPLGDLAKEKHYNNRFLDFWMRYGVFFIDLNGEDLALALSALPQAQKILWMTALQKDHFRKRVGYDKCTENTFLELSALEAVSYDVDLALLEESTISGYLEDGNYNGFINDDRLELCRFDCIDSSDSLNLLKKTWEKAIEINEDRNNIWKERFLQLAYYAKNISIVDRYCGVSIDECYSRGILSGVAYFLKFLSEIPGEIKAKSISIYTSKKIQT